MQSTENESDQIMCQQAQQKPQAQLGNPWRQAEGLDPKDPDGDLPLASQHRPPLRGRVFLVMKDARQQLGKSGLNF